MAEVEKGTSFGEKLREKGEKIAEKGREFLRKEEEKSKAHRAEPREGEVGYQEPTPEGGARKSFGEEDVPNP